MGSARDRESGPPHASGSARPLWPPPARRFPPSDLSSTSLPRPSVGTLSKETPYLTSPVPVPPDIHPVPQQPNLLDRLAAALRVRHYSPPTEQTYRHWVKRYIFFHHIRHPAEMAEPEINAFLTHLAVREKVSASTQTQALSALLFLYRHVIGREVGDLGEIIRAR